MDKIEIIGPNKEFEDAMRNKIKQHFEPVGINVLSLFDGISGTQVALDRMGVKVDNYHASEIDSYAMNPLLFQTSVFFGEELLPV